MALLRKLIRKAIMTPQRIGKLGEAKIDLQLNLVSMFGKSGMVLRNIYVPIQNNQTSEIDLLFITQKGLFVIESKYYSGYIFGNERSQQWTTTLFAGKGAFGRTKVEKHQFYNPIKQNQSHIRALTQYLETDVQYFSIIVFSERCELKNVTVYSPDIHVCQQGALHRIISHIWDTYPDTLSAEKIEFLHSKLLPLTNQDTSVKNQHIQNIQNMSQPTQPAQPTQPVQPTTRATEAPQPSQQTSQTPAAPVPLCPLCGHPLIQRTARHGSNAGSHFWGCSRFPSCRYTKSC